MLLGARRNLLMLLLLATVAVQAFSYALASVQQSQMLPQHHAMMSSASHCEGDASTSLHGGCEEASLAVQQDDCCNEMDNCVSAHCLSLTACPDSHKLVSVSPGRFIALADLQSPLNAYPQSLYRPPITA